MATLRRNNREYRGLTYLHRPTRGRKTLVYQGKRFHKVSESLDTDVEYRRALEEKEKCEKTDSCSVVWTGQPVPEGRVYGTFVRQHRRRIKK